MTEPAGGSVCRTCGRSRPDVEFYRYGDSGQDRAWCVTCSAERYKHQDPGAPLTGRLCPVCDTPTRGTASRVYCSTKCGMKARQVGNDYGLSIEEYRALVDQTGGRCPICRKKSNTSWHIDHSHKSGLIFGAACGRCNTGALAYTYHDPAFVRRLLEFLEDPPAARVIGNRVVPDTGRTKSNLHTIWKRRK